MKKRIKVVVLMGGKSPEHEVSLSSGGEILKNLNPNKYRAFPLVISKTGKGFAELMRLKPDLVFIAMHGPFGEDGTVQGMLETLGFRYTGSGVLASALGMDKLMFREIMKQEKLPIPKYLVVKKGDKVSAKTHLGEPPYVVKPSAQGSSVGVTVVIGRSGLQAALTLAFKYGEKAIIERYIRGIEVTCPVLGNDKPVALPVIEIVPKHRFFDYQSKYSKGGAEEIVPATISPSISRTVQKLAVAVHRLLGCLGFSRTDFILEKGRKPIVLEINTIPGLTPTSLFPKSANAVGISYSQMLDKIIKYALE